MITYSAGGIILNRKLGVVLVENYATVWSFPKGHVEAGESDLDAAIREIGEETGIKELELVKDLGRYQRPRVDKPEEIKEIHMFLFVTGETVLESKEADCTRVEWLAVDKVSGRLTAQREKDFFEFVIPDLNLLK